MKVFQLSVFAENQPGVLGRITAALAEAQVDIQALCIADTTEFGVLRLVVSHPEVARGALERIGYHVSMTGVLALSVGHQPGGLAKALAALGDEVTVEYCYAVLGRDPRRAFVILKCDDNDRAEKLFCRAGFAVLDAEDLC